MRTQFVTTKNYVKLQEGITALQTRGADESCLIVVDGAPGLGKTTCLNHWCVQNNCINIRAKATWTAGWFLNDLLNALEKETRHSVAQRFELAVKALVDRQIQKGPTGKIDAIVLDEADHFSGKIQIMETVRDLSDLTEIPVVLVGMGRIRDNLNRFPQIASRVSRYIKFEAGTIEDVSQFIDALCEVKISPELKKFVHQVSRGWNREIMDAIANMERFGLRNPPEHEDGLRISEMAGEVICNDRQQKKEIIVPEYAQ